MLLCEEIIEGAAVMKWSMLRGVSQNKDIVVVSQRHTSKNLSRNVRDDVIQMDNQQFLNTCEKPFNTSYTVENNS